MLALLLNLLLAPLPKMPDEDVTEEALQGEWLVEWGSVPWEWHVGEFNYWKSEQLGTGGGKFHIGKNGRVEFEYQNRSWGMDLKKVGEEWHGEGWQFHEDGTAARKVGVKIKRKAS